MKLDSVTILPFYNSYDNDIVEEFYNKVFEFATHYDRASAYFDSKILSLYGRGMANIYEKSGKVRFIFSYDLSETDFEKMKDGYSNRNEIEENLRSRISYEELSDEQKSSFENIAYLIKIGLVDIKIAFTKAGIFHDKFGLIYDDDNCVYIRGSNNETEAAIVYSFESFETTCSWNASESEQYKIDKNKEMFERLWNNELNDIMVVEIPEVVKNDIIKFSKDKMNDITTVVYTNKLVLDLDRNNNLLCKNFLNPNKIDIRDIPIKIFLKPFLSICTNEILEFKEGLNYVQIRKVLDTLISYSLEASFDLYATDKLKNYLDMMDLRLDKRRNLGIDIKEHAEYILDKFNEFSEIVKKEMHRELRPMQLWNSFHIVSMIRSANFSVPGSGKTSIVYGAFAYLNRKEDCQVDKIIMIGPRNSFMSWKDEFYENFRDKKQLSIIDVQDEKYKSRNDIIEELRYNSANSNLILINYEKLEGLSDIIKEIIDERTMLVFDEIHKIKSIKGVRAKAALKICEGAKYKVALTGTPIPNSYTDIYNVLKILFNEEYDTFFKLSTIELASADKNDIKAKKVNESIYPFYCRTTKKDLNIPEPNEPDIEIAEMTDDEKRLFECIRKIYSRNILTLYIRLLQASTTPELLLSKISQDDLYSLMYTEDDEMDNEGFTDSDIDNTIPTSNDVIELIDKIGETSKYKRGVNLVNKLCSEGKQVVVWGIFIKTLNNISNSLNELGISNRIVSGSVPQEERDNIIKAFKNKEIQVLITNPHTLAESVSLHKTCHDAVYFEYSFNLTHMLQSRDRINRLGLEPDDYTQYYYLVLQNDDYYNDSVDMKTLKRLDEKEQIMLKSIEGTHLSRIDFDDMEDIRKILDKI